MSENVEDFKPISKGNHMTVAKTANKYTVLLLCKKTKQTNNYRKFNWMNAAMQNRDRTAGNSIIVFCWMLEMWYLNLWPRIN